LGSETIPTPVVVHGGVGLVKALLPILRVPPFFIRRDGGPVTIVTGRLKRPESQAIVSPRKDLASRETAKVNELRQRLKEVAALDRDAVSNDQ
jgi:hypothetical protein